MTSQCIRLESPTTVYDPDLAVKLYRSQPGNSGTMLPTQANHGQNISGR